MKTHFHFQLKNSNPMSKVFIVSIALISTFVFFSFKVNKIHTDVYTVDAAQSSLEWFAESATGKHNGVLKFDGGDIKNNHGHINGSFEFDMNSIENKDMKPGKKKTKFETLLKSEDFFSAEIFPKSKFVIVELTPIKDAVKGGNTHNVRGLLTIKDKTNEISFDAIFNMKGKEATCSGSVVVDRTKFDIKYGSKTFFPNIGDKMISDDFTLKFNVVAVNNQGH